RQQQRAIGYRVWKSPITSSLSFSHSNTRSSMGIGAGVANHSSSPSEDGRSSGLAPGCR
ncbi:14233_t:CDS:1, partial [Acaulospora colombiana]